MNGWGQGVKATRGIKAARGIRGSSYLCSCDCIVKLFWLTDQLANLKALERVLVWLYSFSIRQIESKRERFTWHVQSHTECGTIFRSVV